MSGYKELFLKSQAIIADAIEKLELISDELKQCMLKCEEDIIIEKNKIIKIDSQDDT